MDYVITGIGWVTADGPGRGKEGNPFRLSSDPLPSLSRKDVFAAPNQRFGRQSEYSKTGLAGIALALRDAGLEEWHEKRPVGVIASSQLGCLSTDVGYYGTVLPQGGGLPSPNLFAYTLANCFLGEAAIQFGLTGTAMVINEGEPTGLTPLRLALESLECGECPTMIAGLCDLPAPPLVAGTAAPIPGAVFLVLHGDGTNTTGYGRLRLEADGIIRHDGTVVANLTSLVTECLSRRLSRTPPPQMEEQAAPTIR